MNERSLEVLSARVGSAVTGAVLLWLAPTVAFQGNVAVHHDAAFLSFAVYASAFLMLVAAFTPLAAWPRWPLAVLVLTLAALLYAFGARVAEDGRAYGTDALAVTHAGAKLILDGENPYQVTGDLVPYLEEFDVPEEGRTRTVDGQLIDSLESYPALHTLILVPFEFLGVHDMRWVVLWFEIATLVLVWSASPKSLRPVILLPIFANVDLFYFYTAGAVTDWIWVLPLVGLVLALRAQQLGVAAVLFGLAAATKQQPWVLTPFLLAFVWHTATAFDRRGRSTAVLHFASLALLTFVVINLPFLIWDPEAWFRGTFEPMIGNQVSDGQGLSTLTKFGIVDLRREFYAVAAVVVWLGLAAVYFLRFRELRHAGWILAAIPLWFSFRSFQAYFVYWIPVLLAGALLWWQEVSSGIQVTLPTPSLASPTRFVLLGAASLAVFALVATATKALLDEPSLDARILEVRDEMEMGTVTSIDVQVTNTTDHAVNPIFSVPVNSYVHYWSIDSGPRELGPHETARYTISVIDAAQLPPEDSNLTLNVSDSSSSTFDTTLHFTSRVEEPGVVNPGMRFWQPQPPPIVSMPAGWNAVRDGAAAMRPLDHAGRSSVLLTVDQDGSREWDESGLTQEIDFPSCGLSATVFPEAPFGFAEGGWVTAVFGIAVFDQRNQPIWFVPTSDASLQSYLLPNGFRIEFIDVPPGEWSTIQLDVAGIYEALGLPETDKVFVKPFVAAHSSAPGVYSGYVSEIEAVPCPTQ